MGEAMINIENLTKAYGRKGRALNGLNMTVEPGIVYGLLGRNGAGKSTTLRLLMGLLKPTSGTIEVMGSHPWNMPLDIRQKIGYASDTMQLIPWLNVGHILKYNGSFYPNWDAEYVEQWVKQLRLPLDKRVFQLSKGNRQKLALIMAIGHRPELLLLDEPAGGLDPVARKEFLRSIIELLTESGTTIVLSSHLIGDLERISDQIGLIDKGKMCLQGSLEDLKQTIKQVRVIGANSEDIDQSDLVQLKTSKTVFTAVYQNWTEHKYQRLKQHFPEATIEVNSMNLEEIFIAYTLTPEEVNL